MSNSELPHSAGRACGLVFRVGDAPRAARFFRDLLSAPAQAEGRAGRTSYRIAGAKGRGHGPIDAVFTDDPRAAEQRLCFATPSPEAALARALALGGTGASPDELRDDQGIPFAFEAEEPARGTGDAPAYAALGVVILEVADTRKAREFQRGLFGRNFKRVGAGDYWWVDDDSVPMGIFGLKAGGSGPPGEVGAPPGRVRGLFCVSNFEQAMARVRELGGQVLARENMGPYHVCECRDDQGTAFGLWWDPMK